MKNIAFQTGKTIRKGLLTAVLGLVLWVGSLWGLSYPAQAGTGHYEGEQSNGQITELYDEIQPKVGGINGYNDTDPRRDTAQADAKAKQLRDRANERQREKTTDGPLDSIKGAIDSLRD